MSSEKRDIEGLSIQEKRRLEVEREHHGNETCRPTPQGFEWKKLVCRCGFLMGFQMLSKFLGANYRTDAECVECHRKKHERGKGK